MNITYNSNMKTKRNLARKLQNANRIHRKNKNPNGKLQNRPLDYNKVRGKIDIQITVDLTRENHQTYGVCTNSISPQ